MVKIRGQRIAVKADIHTLGGFSAHADQAGLLRWLEQFHDTPPVVLVHGEREAQDAFARELRGRSTRQVHIPERGDTLVVPRSGADFRMGSRAP
jgi:metallo-beta-lactamase family protein